MQFGTFLQCSLSNLGLSLSPESLHIRMSTRVPPSSTMQAVNPVYLLFISREPARPVSEVAWISYLPQTQLSGAFAQWAERVHDDRIRCEKHDIRKHPDGDTHNTASHDGLRKGSTNGNWRNFGQCQDISLISLIGLFVRSLGELSAVGLSDGFLQDSQGPRCTNRDMHSRKNYLRRFYGELW